MVWKLALNYLRLTAYYNNKRIQTLNSIMPFYAVAKGRTPGIFMNWGDCEAQVKGFSGARYKKFDSIVSAQEFISSEGGNAISMPNNTPYNTKSAFNPSNLKRSYSTTTHQQKHNGESSKSDSKVTKKKQVPSDSEGDDSDGDFDNSDDLDTILMKQMDDIEKRVKGFSKGVDNIIKKSSGGSSQRKTILIEPPKPKKRKSNSNSDFETDSSGFVHVYTDGACSSNGRSGARAGLGVYWGEGHPLNTSEPVSGRATNNCGEIQAATHAIKQAIQNGVPRLAINTDSKFLINSVTKWIPGWKRKGWKLQSGEPVKNEIDFKELDSLQNKLDIKWNYVEAHKGIHGNEMADQLAKAGASKYNK